MDLRQLQQEYLDILRKVTEEKLEIGTLMPEGQVSGISLN